jgi:hypothetical protein
LHGVVETPLKTPNKYLYKPTRHEYSAGERQQNLSLTTKGQQRELKGRRNKMNANNRAKLTELCNANFKALKDGAKISLGYGYGNFRAAYAN